VGKEYQKLEAEINGYIKIRKPLTLKITREVRKLIF